MLNWLGARIEGYMRKRPQLLAACLRRVPRWVVRRASRAKLHKVLLHVWDHSEYQRERWREAGIRRRDLREPDVLRRIPFFDPAVLQEHPEWCACVPERELTHLVNSSGTTGVKKRVYLTTEDLDQQARIMGMRLAALEGARRVLMIFGTRSPAVSVGALGTRAIEKGGLFGLHASHDRTTEEQLELIRDHHIDTIIASVTAMQRITMEAACDLKSLGVKYLLLSAQPWPESLRTELESAWGATVLDVYGLMEFGSGIASECPEKNGLHIASTDAWVEIVDPETTEPMSDGEYGEIVLTTLSRRGMPLVRYRTHDFACLMPENGRCPCGMPTRRLSRVRGRLDHVVIIGNGCNIYPDEIDRAVFGVPGVADYQLTVDREGYQDILGLTVESTEPIEALEEELKQNFVGIRLLRRNILERRTIVFGEFKAVPPGTLSADRMKTVRIVDRRPQAD
jgi:phenylacetate-CoA ligase